MNTAANLSSTLKASSATRLGRNGLYRGEGEKIFSPPPGFFATFLNVLNFQMRRNFVSGEVFACNFKILFKCGKIPGDAENIFKVLLFNFCKIKQICKKITFKGKRIADIPACPLGQVSGSCDFSDFAGNRTILAGYGISIPSPSRSANFTSPARR